MYHIYVCTIHKKLIEILAIICYCACNYVVFSRVCRSYLKCAIKMPPP